MDVPGGINGPGKTSILQALAIVLLGEPLYRELGGDRLERFRRSVEGIRQETRLRAWLQLGTSQRYIEIKLGDKDAMPALLGSYYSMMMQHWQDMRSRVILAYGASRNHSEFRDSRYVGLRAEVRSVMTLSILYAGRHARSCSSNTRVRTRLLPCVQAVTEPGLRR